MNTAIKFSKMHGLGNDFVLIDGDEFQKHNIKYEELAKRICDRNFGVGADGLIIVNPQEIKADTDTSWRIFNSDGSEPQMCGNGIRCFAKYVYEKGMVNKKKFTISTLAGVITPEILDNGEIRVDMGSPIFEASKVPVSIKELDCVIDYPVEVKGKEFNINAVSMGNPHCIIFTEEDTAKLAKEYGSEIEIHELFPEKINVEFVKILARDNIKIDVWERGCGITLACGTGACASVVAAIVNNLVDNTVVANLPGGSLKIEWNQGKEGNRVFMSGKSEFVFHGEYLLTN
ncbi:MAG: diaminopimelate epimerase [Candidatus Melainabacteria bacterium GWF2_32_7]|nr:MAG: diaminopimelate epimerase [Candidatus Melainabacteria bacterium GWF2_32_7]